MIAPTGIGSEIGITGHAALDAVLSNATYKVQERKVEIRLPGHPRIVETAKPVQRGEKAQGKIPPELWDDAVDVRVGGGGPNSCIACKLAAPDLRMSYLDACQPDERIRSRLAYPGLMTKFLGLDPVSKNIVLGDGRDRLILKAESEPTVDFTVEHLNKLKWVSRCRCVLGNSIKRENVAEYLAGEAREGRIELHLVLTPYLSIDLLKRTDCLGASVLYLSHDEIGRIAGWDVGQDLNGAAEVVRRLRALAPQACIYLTRGADGVVVAPPGDAKPACVRLVSHWDRIQEFVSRDSTVLCGSGDAFAGGATLYLRTHRSLLVNGNGSDNVPVTAAIAGCALAVRWMGYVAPLSAADFAVSLLDYPCWFSGQNGFARSGTGAVGVAPGLDLPILAEAAYGDRSSS